MTGKYDDILSLPHPTSSRFPRMGAIERAAQFSPFAALTGYDDAIQETGRLTQQPVELQEDARQDLDQKQHLLLELAHCTPEVSVSYFLPDTQKDGGAYVTVRDRLRSVDPLRRLMILKNGTQIPLDAVIELDSPVFADLFLY